MLSAATANEYLSSVVDEEIRRRFSQTLVSFYDFSPSEKDDLMETEEFLHIRNFPLIVRILNEYGHLIRNLEISTTIDCSLETVGSIYKAIEEHCSDTLRQLHVDSLGYSFFRNIVRPFKAVEMVSLVGNVMDLNNENRSFSELFPAVRQLELNFDAQNSSKIVLEFPFLEHLDVTVMEKCENNKIESESCSSEAMIIGLIKKNPQIQNVILRSGTPNVLKAIADDLKELERLELYQFSERNGQKHSMNKNFVFDFKNVKVFKIGSFDYDFPENIIFSDKLEEFEVIVSSTDTKYLDLIEQSEGLRRLRISHGEGVDYNAMKRLIAANLNVVEMALVHHREVGHGTIIEFVKSCRQLNLLGLTFLPNENIKDEMVSDLRKYFGNEWTVKLWERGLTMERKIKMAPPVDYERLF